MSHSVTIKKNISSLQVLKTLSLLLQGNYTMAELIEKLNEKEEEPVFNNSVISKYINTCRYCGIDIQKSHNKYVITKMPFQLNLSIREIGLIDSLQGVAKSFLVQKANDVFNQFVLNINKFLSKKVTSAEKKTFKTITEIFSRAISSRSKIALICEGKSMLCNPIQIIENGQITFLHVISSGDEKWIPEDKISGIEILDQKYIPEINEQKVIFKLKGDLSKKYDVRENECITGLNNCEIVISNTGEEKDILFSRLMRYDTCCEILYPVKYREDFKKLIEETLKNYGEF